MCTEEQAKKLVDELLSASDDPQARLYARRAKELIDDPDDLNQGGFGICGMSSVLRTMLIHNRSAFVRLLSTIFKGTNFGDLHPAAPLLEGREKQLARKKVHETIEWDHRPDFILARSLGKLLKIANLGVYQEQIQVSLNLMPYYTSPNRQPILLLDLGPLELAEIGLSDLRVAVKKALTETPLPPGFDLDAAAMDGERLYKDGNRWLVHAKYGGVLCPLEFGKGDAGQVVLNLNPAKLESIFKQEGDLGLNYLGVETIMTVVLGKTAASVLCGAGVDAAVQQINLAFDASPKAYVLAFVNGCDGSWRKASAQLSNSFKQRFVPTRHFPDRVAPEAEHILCITDKILDRGGNYLVPAWSWGKKFNAQIPKAHLDSFIHGFTFGSM